MKTGDARPTVLCGLLRSYAIRPPYFFSLVFLNQVTNYKHYPLFSSSLYTIYSILSYLLAPDSFFLHDILYTIYEIRIIKKHKKINIHPGDNI